MSIEYIYELLKDVNDRDQYVKRGELIRCKDCKWYGEKLCLMNWDGYDWAEPDGYCHKAERRSNE